VARRRGARISPFVVAFALSLAVAGCSDAESNPTAASPGTEVEPSPDTSTTSSAEPPPEQFTVDGMTVRLMCSGSGTPTVVLLPGGRDPVADWVQVVDGLGPDTRTCGFEYPGAGDAPRTDEPMTPSIVAETLAGALDAAGEEPPYLLVGHSLAGLSLRVFVGAHPELTAGVVLFDGTPVELIEDDPLGLEEALDWDAEATIEQASAVKSWPDVPVEVLESDPKVEDRTGKLKLLWHQGQLALAALAPHGHHRVVPGAGHFIFHDRLDVALDTIGAVLDEVGTG
jgi:pimeloyl-ACP methyl ester carboxylesterase